MINTFVELEYMKFLNQQHTNLFLKGCVGMFVLLFFVFEFFIPQPFLFRDSTSFRLWK